MISKRPRSERPFERSDRLGAEHPPRSDGRQTSSWLVVAGLSVLLFVPLLVALAVLLRPRWHPLLDMAQTEMRVRDVGSSHPPLIGLAGRIGPFGRQGSHLGPMSFWSLWPFYQLLGASSWALESASVAIHMVAAGTALWIARRRGGITLVLGVALVLAIVMHAYGALLLTQPWNPYLPVLWWFVFLLAVWSVLCGDYPVLPVVVVAGSFCVQTHISYLGLIGGLGALAIGSLGYAAYARRKDPETRHQLVKWGGIAVAIGVVLWIPPVIDQLVHDPGNLSVVRDHFSDPPETPVGLRDGLRVFFAELNPWTLLTTTLVSEGQTAATGGSVLPGIALLLAWATSVVVAWRLRILALVRLDVVLAAATVLGAISSTRIFGFVWYYLLLWVAGMSGLMLLTIGWTIAEVAVRRTSRASRARGTRRVAVVLVGLTVVVVIAFSFDATSADIPDPAVSETVGELAPATADALAERPHDPPYLLTWLPDPLTIGGAGYGMLGELERRGFDVRAEAANAPGATPYRVVTAPDASLEIHVALGYAIDFWRTEHPEFEEIAYHDPRTPKERAEFARLRAQVIRELDSAGLDDRVALVDENLFALGLDSRVPGATRDRVARMAELGLPGAVFLGPPVIYE